MGDLRLRRKQVKFKEGGGQENKKIISKGSDTKVRYLGYLILSLLLSLFSYAWYYVM